MNSQRPFGLLNINKPSGWTSRDVVNCVVASLKPSRIKVGHAGTLDPMAEGVLVLCVGAATRLIQYVQQQVKVYQATFLLGTRSDTNDITGTLAETVDFEPISQSQIESLLPEFTGSIEQIPPRYSAVHIDGKRAYELARSGEEFEIKARTVHVERIEILSYNDQALTLEIECGSGTYIRSIGRDLGERLGCGAVMSTLTRTRIGVFPLAESISAERFKQGFDENLVLPPLLAVHYLPQILCSEEEQQLLVKGRKIVHPVNLDIKQGTPVVMLNEAQELIAIADYAHTRSEFQPRSVFLKG